jgi:hypothetical protein
MFKGQVFFANLYQSYLMIFIPVLEIVSAFVCNATKVTSPDLLRVEGLEVLAHREGERV